jgi:nitrite reductase (NO-forming)
MWIIVVTLLLLFLGFVFFDRHSGWFDSKVYAPYGTADQVQASQPVSETGKMLVVGKQKYEMFCGSCHGSDGMGKAGVAPPLAGSEIVVAKGFHRLTMIPLQGLAGPIKVKNQDWNMNMAAMGAALPDYDLAGVMTYIRNSWGNKAGDVTAEDIKDIRAHMDKSGAQIQGSKLMEMSE